MPVSPQVVPYNVGRRWAQRLHTSFKQLSPTTAPPLMACQEALARALGHVHWHAYAAAQNLNAETTPPLPLKEQQRDISPSFRAGFAADTDQNACFENIPSSLVKMLDTLVWREGSVLHLEVHKNSIQVRARENVHNVTTWTCNPTDKADWISWAQRWKGLERPTMVITLGQQRCRLTAVSLNTVHGLDVTLLVSPMDAIPLPLSALGHSAHVVRALTQTLLAEEPLVVVIGQGSLSTLGSIVHQAQQVGEGRGTVIDLLHEATFGLSPEALVNFFARDSQDPAYLAVDLNHIDSNFWPGILAPRPMQAVFGQLHAWHVGSALARMIDQGADPTMLVQRLPSMTFVHQKMFDRLCPHCSATTETMVRERPERQGMVDRIAGMFGVFGLTCGKCKLS